MDLFVFILISFCVLMSLTSELETSGPKFIFKNVFVSILLPFRNYRDAGSHVCA